MFFYEYECVYDEYECVYYECEYVYYECEYVSYVLCDEDSIFFHMLFFLLL